MDKKAKKVLADANYYIEVKEMAGGIVSIDILRRSFSTPASPVVVYLRGDRIHADDGHQAGQSVAKDDGSEPDDRVYGVTWSNDETPVAQTSYTYASIADAVSAGSKGLAWFRAVGTEPLSSAGLQDAIGGGASFFDNSAARADTFAVEAEDDPDGTYAWFNKGTGEVEYAEDYGPVPEKKKKATTPTAKWEKGPELIDTVNDEDGEDVPMPDGIKTITIVSTSVAHLAHVVGEDAMWTLRGCSELWLGQALMEAGVNLMDYAAERILSQDGCRIDLWTPRSKA